MHWWNLPFSSPSSKSQSADDILIAAAGSGKTGFFRRGKLTRNDADEWRSESYPQHSRHRGGCGEEREVERGRRMAEGHGLDEQLKRLVGENARTSVEQSEIRLSRKSPMKQYAEERSSCNCSIIIPKSAPTSPYSSPVSSPPCSDTSITYYMSPFHALSSPEMPNSKGNIGLSFNHQMPSDKTALRVDDSPLTSRTVSSPFHAEILPEPVLPVPSKISLEIAVARRENTAQTNVHTLPLPPGADMSSLPTPGSSNSSTSDLSGATMSFPPTPISTRVARPELPGVKQASPISQAVGKPEPIPIRSQWQKGKLIGKGTFGSVYVASNRETGALCAMKEVEILREDLKSQECMRQLEQEIKVLSNLKHPNIVQYYGSEIVGDKFYIYLEYVHPGSINKFIHDHCAAITESVVRNFTRHILCGLAYLHSTKTIHRDIKGANLLVDAYGVVKLADFGMAKHLTGEAANLSLKGSPYWLAPEPVVPKEASSDLHLAVDIWSLGCTIIEMINGKPPWSDCEGPAAMFKVLKESPPIPETLSADGKDFLQCCFRRNPTDRPTAMKLLDHRFVNCSQSLKEDTMQMQFRQGQSCHTFNQVPASLDKKMKKGKLAIK
ncbi:mitogen-activated protein kinase kinase kinase 5 [Perilla frutescens var. hirtella]|nr:mitogen-activated protein kinase kinase kinase 5 [Perilla frutescens var. hirtella]